MTWYEVPLPSTTEEEESVVHINEESQEEPAAEVTHKHILDFEEPNSEEPALGDGILRTLMTLMGAQRQEAAPRNEAGDIDTDTAAMSGVLEPDEEVPHFHGGTLDPVAAPVPAATNTEAEALACRHTLV